MKSALWDSAGFGEPSDRTEFVDGKWLDAQHARQLSIHRPYFSGPISETLLDRFLESKPDARSTLTDREREVVQLIAEGKINKEISRVLNISVKTVETRRASAMRNSAESDALPGEAAPSWEPGYPELLFERQEVELSQVSSLAPDTVSVMLRRSAINCRPVGQAIQYIGYRYILYSSGNGQGVYCGGLAT